MYVLSTSTASVGHGQRRGSPVRVDLVALRQRLLGRGGVGRSVLGSPSRSARCWIGDQIDLEVGVGGNRRADVAPFDDDAIVVVRDRLALHRDELLTYGWHGGDMAHGGGDVLAADRLGDVDSVGMDRGIERIDARLELYALGRRGNRVGIAEIRAGLQERPRHRAVHRARVEVREAEPIGHSARRARLAGSGRTVDGNDQGRAHASARSRSHGAPQL